MDMRIVIHVVIDWMADISAVQSDLVRSTCYRQTEQERVITFLIVV